MDLLPITAEVTAYDAHCAACGTTGRTASGRLTAQHPYGLAASPGLPFGAWVIIPAGHGLLDNARAFDRSFQVDDRGGAVTREALESGILRIDLRVLTHAAARRIGRQRITVYLVRNHP